jgi:hypothetical protein
MFTQQYPKDEDDCLLTFVSFLLGEKTFPQKTSHVSLAKVGK